MREEKLQLISQRYKKNHKRVQWSVMCQHIRQPRRNG